MVLADKHGFEQLRIEVEARFREGHPHCHVPISEWKGQWIVDFQEDLLVKVQGRVSEKWFYTYFRTSEVTKLPRIDMLNLLSRYVGETNWATFRDAQDWEERYRQAQNLNDASSITPEEDFPNTPVESSGQSKRNKTWTLASVLLGSSAVIALLFLFGFKNQKVEFNILFMDAFTQTEVDHLPKATYWMENRWKTLEIVGGKGKIEGVRGEDLQIAVSGGYCQTDTFLLEFPVNGEEVPIYIKPDDFALMIHIFSRSDVEDWRSRREKLTNMIAESAEIFQVDPDDQVGMEMFNKEEFIDKLTMPVLGLENIEILETKHDREGRISGLRFIQKRNP